MKSCTFDEGGRYTQPNRSDFRRPSDSTGNSIQRSSDHCSKSCRRQKRMPSRIKAATPPPKRPSLRSRRRTENPGRARHTAESEMQDDSQVSVSTRMCGEGLTVSSKTRNSLNFGIRLWTLVRKSDEGTAESGRGRGRGIVQYTVDV